MSDFESDFKLMMKEIDLLQNRLLKINPQHELLSFFLIQDKEEGKKRFREFMSRYNTDTTRPPEGFAEWVYSLGGYYVALNKAIAASVAD